MLPVLCVRHQPNAGLGMLAEVLERDGVDVAYLDAWRATGWPSPAGYSGVVVLGGDMNVDQLDDHPWMRNVRVLVEQALGERTPLLGICLGAQTMARALGAGVVPSAAPEVGFRPLAVTSEGRDDPVLGAFEDGIRVFQWHEDSFELPQEATLLHRGLGDGNQSFRVGDNAYGTQFHFEVTEEVISGWCRATDPEDLESYWNVTADGLLDAARRFLPVQQAAARRAVRGFASLLRRG